MPAIILKGDDFVGITDDKRRAIYEAEQAAASMGVLPDDKEKRDAIIDRLQRRLAAANLGWGINATETVVRVDDQGVARIIPKSQAVGWMPGLPASPDTRDRSSSRARVGRTKPYEEKVFFSDPGEIRPVSSREAAARFHARIVAEMQKTGYIPVALRQELATEGWKIGQPIPRSRVDEWCSRFQAEWHNKYREG